MNLEYPRQLTQVSSTLLQSILEGLIDGVLILTRNGEWICSNSSAHDICQQLNQGKPQKPQFRRLFGTSARHLLKITTCTPMVCKQLSQRFH